MLIRIGGLEVKFGFCREFFVRIPFIGQMHYSPQTGMHADSWKTYMTLEGKHRPKGFCLVFYCCW